MFGNKLKVSLYRYSPEDDQFPYMKEYTIDKPERDIMVLDLLHILKEDDQSISRSEEHTSELQSQEDHV